MSHGGVHTPVSTDPPTLREEVKTMQTEFRYCEMRADADNRNVAGTAVKYGDEANIGGLFTETIERGALRFASDGILMNVQHDRGRPIARSDGGGLTLLNSDQCLEVSAHVVETRDGDDCLQLVKAGVLKGLSIEMHVTRDKWNADYTKRAIQDAVLTAVAICDKPAYGQSTLTVARAACPTASEPAPWRVI